MDRKKSIKHLYVIFIVILFSLSLIDIYKDNKVSASEDVISYTLDENSEITYYREKGPYGRVEYTKRHFTTGSGIRYYTRYFVISIGQIDNNTELNHLSSDNSISLLVSENGESKRKNEVDTSKDFYWYETSADASGYITTTYSIDGKIFYDLLGKAASNGKKGEIFIHHVFAITGGSNSDSWHTEYHVTNHKEYWKYSDLYRLGWNDTTKTQQSQEKCKNVPVPYRRNIRFVTCYYDDLNGKPLMTETEMKDFYTDSSNTIANIIAKNIEPEIEIGSKKYEVFKSLETPFVFKWIKVPADCKNPEESFCDPVTNSYNKNPVDGDRIKIKAVTNDGEAIKNGKIDSIVSAKFNLGDNISGYTWVVILYVPVRIKSNTSDLYLHFFDSESLSEVGSYLLINEKIKEGTTYKISGLKSKLISQGVIGYKIDTDCGFEFTAKSNSSEVVNSYVLSRGSYLGQGNMSSTTYTTPKVSKEKYTVAWIPVKKVKQDVPLSPSGEISVSYMEPEPTAVVKAKKGTPFDVICAIPSSEYIYSEVKSNNYLIRASFTNTVGSKEHSITIVQPYTVNISYKTYDEDGEFKGYDTYTYSSETSRSVSIKRPYSYWEIASVEYYKAQKGNIMNDSVNNKMVAEFKDEIPKLIYNQKDSYVEWVREPVSYYVLPSITVYGSDEYPPVIPVLSEERAKGVADGQVPEIKVRNDKMTFDGSFVINDNWKQGKEVITDEPVLSTISEPKKVMAESKDEQIPAKRENIIYDSSGNIEYELVAGIGAGSGKLEFEIDNINEVIVHTPVINNLKISSDNLKYVQTLNVDIDKIQIVLGRSESYGSEGIENSSNDFEVKIENRGQHISAPGYGDNLNTEKYIAKNQIKFDFDVIADVGEDGIDDNDLLISAGTWNKVYDSYYVPEWVLEGIYKAEARSFAINAGDTNDGKEEYANLSQDNYIAYSVNDIQISGKMYGFTLTSNDSDAKEWRKVFVYGDRIKNAYPDKYIDGTLKKFKDFDEKKRYYYTSGINNELGYPYGIRSSKYVFPLINGSSPAKKNAGLLKSGYTWNFKLETVGSRTASENSAIVIVPSFYWVKKDGNGRERVAVWYKDKVNGKKYNYIQIGDSIDLMNNHYDYAASRTAGVVSDELLITNTIRGDDKKSNQNVNVYSYGLIENNGFLKTYSGNKYARYLINKKLVDAKKYLDLSKYKQSWYFEYGIPDEWYACPYNYDVKSFIEKNGGCNFNEDFWYKKGDGYLIVHFEIGAYDSNGLFMTYSNDIENTGNGCCNMWNMEGFTTKRIDSDGNIFSFEEGDVIMLGTSKWYTSSGDYEIDHLN